MVKQSSTLPRSSPVLTEYHQRWIANAPQLLVSMPQPYPLCVDNFPQHKALATTPCDHEAQGYRYGRQRYGDEEGESGHEGCGYEAYEHEECEGEYGGDWSESYLCQL